MVPTPAEATTPGSRDVRSRARAGSNSRDGGIVPADELPEVLQFMRLLWAVVHALDRTSKRMATDLGVTGPQRLVLRVVGLFPGTSAGHLASLLHVHPSTLTGVLQRLVQLGLLTRKLSPTDRRRAVLTLTTKGKRANQTNAGTVESAVGRSMRRFSTIERTALKRALTLLAGSLTPADGA